MKNISKHPNLFDKQTNFIKLFEGINNRNSIHNDDYDNDDDNDNDNDNDNIDSNLKSFLNKQSNFKKLLEGIDFNVINGSSEVNNYNKNNKNTSHNKCSECGSDDLIEDHVGGILVCKICGQVLDQILDYNPEWKQYDDGDNNARCGGAINPLLPTSSLGTSIAGAFKNRMKTIHGWNQMLYKERSLNNEFKKIHYVCQKYNILKCIEEDAKIMYKMASECKHQEGKNFGKFIITRGKNRVSISAACLYFACVKKGITYTPKEIADFYEIKYSEINKGIKNLRKLINSTFTSKSNLSLPSQFIKRYCNNLKILNCYAEEAVNVALNIEKLNIATEHNPYSLAAACILFVAENHKLKHVTRKRLAAEFDISDVTINKTYKKIEVYKDVIFDKNKTEILSKKSILYEQEDTEIPPEILEKMKQYGIISDCQMENESKSNSEEEIKEKIKINIDEEYEKILLIGKLYDKMNNEMQESIKSVCDLS
jgi:transcription initiation factor TFIIIB Brf1 subunit/transcription initiation factor TFIIB